MWNYTKHLGTDRFCVRVNGILLTGINSDYLKDETRDPSKEENQFRCWPVRSKRKGPAGHLLSSHTTRSFSGKSTNRTLFDHFAGKTPEIFRTVPGNRCANRLYGTFARQRGDIVRQHRNDNTSAVGRPLGDAPSGVRIIVIKDRTIIHGTIRSMKYRTLEPD